MKIIWLETRFDNLDDYINAQFILQSLGYNRYGLFWMDYIVDNEHQGMCIKIAVSENRYYFLRSDCRFIKNAHLCTILSPSAYKMTSEAQLLKDKYLKQKEEREKRLSETIEAFRYTWSIPGVTYSPRRNFYATGTITGTTQISWSYASTTNSEE
jgi:hypothetical protein